jgi:tetratricopeptide (TPR) repeat protein
MSGRAAYGLALYRAGQFEPASEQFREILACDPNHLLALKYLGDIAYVSGDEWTALANYRRILEIDPECRGLYSRIPKRGPRETTRTISLVRPLGETSAGESRTPRIISREPVRRGAILVSETVGDLYLSQGHARQAADVYKKLCDQQPTPQLADKLARALEKVSEREPIHVAETDD